MSCSARRGVLKAHLESEFHQPGLQGRAADRVHPPSARSRRRRRSRSDGRRRFQWRRHRRRDRGVSRRGRHCHARAGDAGRHRVHARAGGGGASGVAGAFRGDLRSGDGGRGGGGASRRHLFNRMTPLGHREPGLAGAVLRAEELAAEIICDGHHVHPATVRLAIDVKRPGRVMSDHRRHGRRRPARRLQGDHRRPADHRHQHRRVSRRWHAGGEHVDDGRRVQDAGEHDGV